MTLSEGFVFNQGNLQDYQDCQRRFQLRYLLQIAWPALEAQPAIENENLMQMGTVFHNLIRQHQSGVSVDLLFQAVHNYSNPEQTELLQWWDNYLTAISRKDEIGSLFQSSQPTKSDVFTEISYSIPLGGFRIVAKYDLLLTDSSGFATIIDWKTNRKRPTRYWLQERMQSRIYPYVLVKANSNFPQEHLLEPEQVRMLYWFANFPSKPEALSYSTEQYLADENYFLSLINRIKHTSEQDFHLTHNEAHCRFCCYRSLCNRGVQAGDFDSAESLDTDIETEHIEINMQGINEIEF